MRSQTITIIQLGTYGVKLEHLIQQLLYQEEHQLSILHLNIHLLKINYLRFQCLKAIFRKVMYLMKREIGEKQTLLKNILRLKSTGKGMDFFQIIMMEYIPTSLKKVENLIYVRVT